MNYTNEFYKRIIGDKYEFLVADINDTNKANIAVNLPPTNSIKRLKITISIFNNLLLISTMLNKEYIAILDIAATPISCS